MKGDKVFLDTNLLYAFWDSLVIQSAIEGGARWLLSEDLRDGQRIGDLTIRNPFLHE